jgi:hypothetical protein
VKPLRSAASVPRMSTVNEDSTTRTGSEDPKGSTKSTSLWTRIQHGVKSKIGRNNAAEGDSKAPVPTEASNDYDASMVDVLDTVGTSTTFASP